MMKRNRRCANGVVLTAVSLLTIQCGTGGTTRSELVPFPVVEPTTGFCGLAVLPLQLPPVAAIVDSASLVSALTSARLKAGNTVFTIVIGGTYVAPTTRLFETNLEPPEVTTLTAAVEAALGQEVTSSTPWGARLSITTGDVVAAKLVRSEYCPPVAPEVQARSQLVTMQISADQVAQLQREARESEVRLRRMRQYEARCLVDRDGKVVVVEVVTSSGDHRIDNDMNRRLYRTRFAPATLDGISIAGWWFGNPMLPHI